MSPEELQRKARCRCKSLMGRACSRRGEMTFAPGPAQGIQETEMTKGTGFLGNCADLSNRKSIRAKTADFEDLIMVGIHLMEVSK